MTSDRVPCPHRPECDGCPLWEATDPQHDAYKLAALQEGVAQLPSLAETPWGERWLSAPRRMTWRHRARMVVHRDATRPEDVLGFYRARSRDVLPIRTCLVHAPAVEAALQALRAPLYQHASLRRLIRFVEARQGSDAKEGESTLVEVSLSLDGSLDEAHAQALNEFVAQWHEALAEAESVRGQLIVESGRVGVAIGSGTWSAPGSEETIEPIIHHVSGVDLEVPPGAFFQMYPSQLERAHEVMRAWVEEAGEQPTRIIDLYGGVGAHGIALAKSLGVGLVVADASTSAIEAASRNAARAGVEATVIAASDDQWREVVDEALRGPGKVLVIVNPARAGIDRRLVRWIGEHASSIAQLFYVSCEPITLRRDLVRLAHEGITCREVVGVDFLPNTDKVEGIARCMVEESHVPRREDSEGPASSTSWWAMVAKKPPVQGSVVQGRRGDASDAIELTARRTHYFDHTQRLGGVSAIRITASEPIDASSLRQRLRAWGHPVVGDSEFGWSKLNYQASRRIYLDRAALCDLSEDAIDEDLVALWGDSLREPEVSLEQDAPPEEAST